LTSPYLSGKLESVVMLANMLDGIAVLDE
jgi:hypothetical protein